MIKSFMEFVQLKNEGVFDFFRPKKPKSPADNTAGSPAADVNSVKKKKTIPLDTYDPYTAEYSPLTSGSSYISPDQPDKIAGAENQLKTNRLDSYLKKSELHGKFDPAIKYIAMSEFSFPNGTKKIEDDIKRGKFSYDTNNVPKMMLFLLNQHADGSYLPFFGSLVKNNAVNMIPYNLALRIMETTTEKPATWTFKSFIAKHLLEKTPNKIRNIKELEPIKDSLLPTDGWERGTNKPDFLQHIKQEDIKDIWLKFFEKRPDLAKQYYEEKGEKMRLNQKYKQSNDLRYQKLNDMENAISIIVGDKNESFNPYKKSSYDW